MEFEEYDHRTGMIFVERGKARLTYHTHRLAYDIDLSKFKQIRPSFAVPLIATKQYNKTPETYSVWKNLTDTLHQMDRNIASIQYFKAMLIYETQMFIQELLQSDHQRSFGHIENEIEPSERSSGHDDTYNEAVMVKNKSTLLQTYAVKQNQLADKILTVLQRQRFEITDDAVQISLLLTYWRFLDAFVDFLAKHPFEIYRTISVKSPFSYDSWLTIEIEIPVIDQQPYAIVEILPIPMTVNDHTIVVIPTVEFMLINDDNNDVDDCVPISIGQNFNFSNITVFNRIKPKLVNCETSLLLRSDFGTISRYCNYHEIPNGNYIVPIDSEMNFYYISVIEPMATEEQCSDGKQTNQTLSKSGLLRLSGDCDFYIDGQIRINSSSNNDNVDAIKIRAVNNVTEANAIAVIKDRISAMNYADTRNPADTFSIHHPVDNFKKLIQAMHSHRIKQTKLNKTIYSQKHDNNGGLYSVGRTEYAVAAVMLLIFVTVAVKITDCAKFSKNFEQKHDEFVQKFAPSAPYPTLPATYPLRPASHPTSTAAKPSPSAPSQAGMLSV